MNMDAASMSKVSQCLIKTKLYDICYKIELTAFQDTNHSTNWHNKHIRLGYFVHIVNNIQR